MIPIIYGWGKNSKKIADVGLIECNNCNNIVGAEIREISNSAKIYFISVLKWSKKYYLTCPVCNAGYELTTEKKNEIIQSTITLPKNTTSIDIWNEIVILLNAQEKRVKKMKDAEEVTSFVINELETKGFKKDDITYVFDFYINNIIKSARKEQEE